MLGSVTQFRFLFLALPRTHFVSLGTSLSLLLGTLLGHQKMNLVTTLVCRVKWELISVNFYYHQCLFWHDRSQRIGYGLGCVLKLPCGISHKAEGYRKTCTVLVCQNQEVGQT